VLLYLIFGGDTYFCEGGSVLLEASPGAQYLWSTGENTSFINATETDLYSVIVKMPVDVRHYAEVYMEELPELQNWYYDLDSDGYGDPQNYIVSCYNQPPLLLTAGDCDDNNASINPLATEICDCTDNDCDGLIDEGLDMETAMDLLLQWRLQ
jgi:hypothetical protein